MAHGACLTLSDLASKKRLGLQMDSLVKALNINLRFKTNLTEFTLICRTQNDLEINTKATVSSSLLVVKTDVPILKSMHQLTACTICNSKSQIQNKCVLLAA